MAAKVPVPSPVAFPFMSGHAVATKISHIRMATTVNVHVCSEAW